MLRETEQGIEVWRDSILPSNALWTLDEYIHHLQSQAIHIAVDSEAITRQASARHSVLNPNQFDIHHPTHYLVISPTGIERCSL